MERRNYRQSDEGEYYSLNSQKCKLSWKVPKTREKENLQDKLHTNKESSSKGEGHADKGSVGDEGTRWN